MDKQRLKSLLHQLEAELRAADVSADPENRARMQRVVDDIRPLLAGRDVPAAHYEGLRDRLSEVATEFEAEHPRIGSAIENVINFLAQVNL
jgi:hypothetical protein